MSRCTPSQPADRALRPPLDQVQPPDLSPLLHADHTPSSSPDHSDQARVRDQPDTTDSAPGGPLFNRRRWPSIQPAPTLREPHCRHPRAPFPFVARQSRSAKDLRRTAGRRMGRLPDRGRDVKPHRFARMVWLDSHRFSSATSRSFRPRRGSTFTAGPLTKPSWLRHPLGNSSSRPVVYGPWLGARQSGERWAPPRPA